jgi:hypothetical protein
MRLADLAAARWRATRALVAGALEGTFPNKAALPESAHRSQPWAIHALTPDFELADVWALPTPGGPGDLPELVAIFGRGELGAGSRASRALFAIRFKLGEWLRWDDDRPGAPSLQPSLRDRLGPRLREAPAGAVSDHLPFTPLYMLEHEWAAEIINRTVHGVVHVGWVCDAGDDRWHGQLAVLVKPNGRLGRVYMMAITPFRYLVVYPAMIRQIGRAWAARTRHAGRDPLPPAPIA